MEEDIFLSRRVIRIAPSLSSDGALLWAFISTCLCPHSVYGCSFKATLMSLQKFMERSLNINLLPDIELIVY